VPKGGSGQKLGDSSKEKKKPGESLQYGAGQPKFAGKKGTDGVAGLYSMTTIYSQEVRWESWRKDRDLLTKLPSQNQSFIPVRGKGGQGDRGRFKSGRDAGRGKLKKRGPDRLDN